MQSSAPEHQPAESDFYRVNRGGGLYSEAVSQRLGAKLALFGYRKKLAPTTLTIFNLGISAVVSALVIATAGPVAAGSVPGVVIGLIALTGWQLAYAFDCADGQLARVTGQTSPDGARVDILCDVAGQIALVGALSAVAVAQEPETPAWLIALFAGGWMVNLITSVMSTGPQAVSMLKSNTLPIRVVKLVRDYGAIIAVAGIVLTVAPIAMVWFIGIFTLINGAFLLTSIAFSARNALRTHDLPRS